MLLLFRGAAAGARLELREAADPVPDVSDPVQVDLVSIILCPVLVKILIT